MDGRRPEELLAGCLGTPAPSGPVVDCGDWRGWDCWEEAEESLLGEDVLDVHQG